MTRGQWYFATGNELRVRQYPDVRFIELEADEPTFIVTGGSRETRDAARKRFEGELVESGLRYGDMHFEDEEDCQHEHEPVAGLGYQRICSN